MNCNKLFKVISAHIQAIFYAINDNITELNDFFNVNIFKDNIEIFLKGNKASCLLKIRNSYNEEINKLAEKYLNEFQNIHQNEMSLSTQIATEVSENRDIIKLAKQAETPFIGRISIYARNIIKYNDKNGPSSEYKYKNLKCDTELFAYKSLTTNGSDLELSSNDVGKAVEDWIKIRDYFSDIFPEDLIVSPVESSKLTLTGKLNQYYFNGSSFDI